MTSNTTTYRNIPIAAVITPPNVSPVPHGTANAPPTHLAPLDPHPPPALTDQLEDQLREATDVRHKVALLQLLVARGRVGSGCRRRILVSGADERPTVPGGTTGPVRHEESHARQQRRGEQCGERQRGKALRRYAKT